MLRLAHPQKRVSVGGAAVGVVDLGGGDVGAGGANVSAFGSAAADSSARDGTLEFTIPKRPIRKTIAGLPAFTTVRGGAYFFLPGLKAQRWVDLET
jgi:hypothetical protein